MKDMSLQQHSKMHICAHAAQADSDSIKKLIGQRLADPATSGEKWLFRAGDGEGGETMLLVHQTQRQRQMLLKYGGSAVCMDATYRTTMWDIPMFIISVVTNHGTGYPVALFFVEHETTNAITEALRV
jgi:hypothetical protein